MGGTTCIICRCTWKNENVSMFTVPRNYVQRQLWNKACDRLLRENGRVCEKHFRKEDFIEYDECLKMKRKKRLKKHSIPSLFLRRPEKCADFDDLLLSEPEHPRPVDLINEELFDEKRVQIVPSPIPIPIPIPIPPKVATEEAIVHAKPDVELSADSYDSTSANNSKAVQTCASGKQACGLLEVTVDKKTFSISCFYCADEFPIWCWTKFVAHLREVHKNVENAENADDSLFVDKCDDGANSSCASDQFKCNDDRVEVNYSPAGQPWEEACDSTECEDVLVEVTVESEGKNNEQYVVHFADDEAPLHESPAVHEEVNDNGSPICPLIMSCSLCERKFADEHQLQIHQSADHLVASFPYKCSRCDWRYTSRELVRLHEVEHTKAEKYFCEKCDKGFTENCQLQEHMAVHKVCGICNKVLNSSYYYRRHMVLHYPPKHKCHICLKKFHYEDRLRDHIKEHRNQRDHICDECGAAFVRKKNLWEHKKMQHPNAVARSPIQLNK